MSDAQIYYWIYSYCLDLVRLRRLGFPLESELHPGASVVYVDPDLAPLNDEIIFEDDIILPDAAAAGIKHFLVGMFRTGFSKKSRGFLNLWATAGV